MDFSLPPAVEELRRRVDAFVRRVVYPLEPEGREGLAVAALDAARAKAKAEGLWAPQLPRDLGGLGLTFHEVCPVFEAAGQSLLGPLVLGCSAPDEGNAHLLLRAGSPEQRDKYLRPLAAGRVRSAFAMTEPAPGAGSDPRMMRTRAAKDAGGYTIDGHKWFATGAAGAAFVIVAAVTDPRPETKDRCTLFVVDAGTPGFEIVREVPTLGGGTPGGHCEIVLRGCRVPLAAVLGSEGQGLRLIQERLGPARLTHCMRWLGAARRALEIAVDRASKREAFGRHLGEHQAVQWMLADTAIELQAARMMTYEAAWRVARGEDARREVSMCKVFVAESVCRAIDRAIQVCGALGISHDTPLAHLFAEARAFRIYDGPSEVHRMVVARDLLREAATDRES